MSNIQATVEVRSVRHDELPALLTLYEHLHATDAPASDAAFEEQWQALLHDPKMHCLVAVLDGALVASCTLVVVPNLTRGARPYGLIENVVTHAAYRERGIGSRVLREALRIAWVLNCYKVMLLTGSKRASTLRFYEHVGFRRDVKTGFTAYPDDPAP